MGNHRKGGSKKGGKSSVGASKEGGTQCPLPLFYPQLSDAVAKVRPFWDQLSEKQRQNLLSAKLENVRERAKELSKTLQKEAQVARDSSLVFDFEIKSYESVLDEALQRLNGKDSFKLWIGLNGEEFCTREEFQKYLELELENEDNLLEILKRAKQGDGRSEKELQGRMEKLLRVIHEQISKFQQQLSKSSCSNMMFNGYRFPHLRIGCMGGNGVSESLHRKNRLLVRMILQSMSKERHLLFESFLNAIRDFTSRICEEDGVMDVDVQAPYEEFMDDMNMDDVGHLCEWLIEKIDCLASTKWKPSEQELEEEEDEGDILGDVDLFCLTEDGSSLQPNPRWLEHLMSRQIDADGQPRKVDAETSLKEKNLSDGLVLDWLYGSIVSTAEKARDAAQKPLGMDRPSLHIELTLLRKSLKEIGCLYSQQEGCLQLIKRLDEIESWGEVDDDDDGLNQLRSDVLRERELFDVWQLQLHIQVCLKKSMEIGLQDDDDEELCICKTELQHVQRWLDVLNKLCIALQSGKINDVDEYKLLITTQRQRSAVLQGEFSVDGKLESVRQNCQSTLQLIKDQIFEQEAVVSFFEFNLVNVACDDLGAVIGVEILLPMIQENIEQQADEYFTKQAELLQQQILEMEAAEKEEAEKKKQRKKNKKKAKKAAVGQHSELYCTEELVQTTTDIQNQKKGQLKEEQVKKESQNTSTASCVEQLVIEYLTHHENEIHLVSEPNRTESTPDPQQPKPTFFPQENLPDAQHHTSDLVSTNQDDQNTQDKQDYSQIYQVVESKELNEDCNQYTQDKQDYSQINQVSEGKELKEDYNQLVSCPETNFLEKHSTCNQCTGDKLDYSQDYNQLVSCPEIPINYLDENQSFGENGDIQEEEETCNFEEGYVSLDGCSIEDTCYQTHDNNFLCVSPHCDGSSEVGCSSYALPASALHQKNSGLDCSSECGARTPPAPKIMDSQVNEAIIFNLEQDNICTVEQLVSNTNLTEDLPQQDVLQQDHLDQLQALLSQSQLTQLNSLLQQSQPSQAQTQLNQLNNMLSQNTMQNQFPVQVQQGGIIQHSLGRGQKAQSYQSLQDLVSMHQYSSISRPSFDSMTSLSTSAQAGLEQRVSKAERELNDACKQLTNAVIGLENIKEQLCCPLTGGLMSEPVVAADGYTYDRVSIEQWLLSSGNSPVTEQPLQSPILIPNRSIKRILHQVKQLGVVGLVGLL